MPSKTFPGDYKSLAKIGKFITEIARLAGFDSSQIYSVQLAVDEACTNIIEHGYGGEGQGDIICECEQINDGLEIKLRDWGKSFQPNEIPEPDYEVPLEKLQSRGAGLFLMQKTMDEVQFQFDEKEGNLLTLVKRK